MKDVTRVGKAERYIQSFTCKASKAGEQRKDNNMLNIIRCSGKQLDLSEMGHFNLIL